MPLCQKILTLIIVCLLLSCAPGNRGSQNLIIATATPGGTYYPVGVAVGTLVSTKLQPHITASAINSAGSGENIQMLSNNEADLAILQGLYGALAFDGKGPYEGHPIQGFRSITMLWQNVEHFLLLKQHAQTGNILDLQNLNAKFSVGKRGSGTEGSTRAIFSVLDITPNLPEYLGYTASVQAMMDTRIGGATIPAGPPVAAVTQAFAQLGADGLEVLQFTDEQVSAIQSEYPVWNRYLIRPGTYPNQETEIQTIAQPNFLACRADLPDDAVYRITKTIYENLPFLQNIHQATKAMALHKAIDGLSVPLHPGASRYYKERGLKLP